MKRVVESHFTSGHTLEDLPFEDKQKLLKLIFGGRDADGVRYGIFISYSGGKERRFKFEAYGRLGNLNGCVETRSGERAVFPETKIFTQTDTEIAEAVAGLLPRRETFGRSKAHTSSIHQAKPFTDPALPEAVLLFLGNIYENHPAGKVEPKLLPITLHPPASPVFISSNASPLAFALQGSNAGRVEKRRCDAGPAWELRALFRRKVSARDRAGTVPERSSFP